jgi:hypothetical protein
MAASLSFCSAVSLPYYYHPGPREKHREGTNLTSLAQPLLDQVYSLINVVLFGLFSSARLTGCSSGRGKSTEESAEIRLLSWVGVAGFRLSLGVGLSCFGKIAEVVHCGIRQSVVGGRDDDGECG